MNQATREGKQVGALTGLWQVYGHLSPKLRRQFVAVLVLMLFGGLAELATIGSVVPFLAFLSQSETSQLPQLTGLLVTLGQAIGTDSVTAAAVVFASFAIVAGLIRIALSWLTQRFIFGLSH